MLVKASQDAEINTAESGEQKTPRFLAPLSDVELKNLKESAIQEIKLNRLCGFAS